MTFAEPLSLKLGHQLSLAPYIHSLHKVGKDLMYLGLPLRQLIADKGNIYTLGKTSLYSTQRIHYSSILIAHRQKETFPLNAMYIIS